MNIQYANTCAAAASLRNKLCRLKSMCKLSVACLILLLWLVCFGHCRRKCFTWETTSFLL